LPHPDNDALSISTPDHWLTMTIAVGRAVSDMKKE
jgi:hypothetical protein